MFGLKNRDQKVRELISGLIDRMEKLERDMRAQQLDWENTYDKLRTMMQRIAKRAEAVQNAEQTPTQLGEEPVPGDGKPAGFLTPRQREVQQMVLRRRRGLS